jgi:hypothetical protein
MTFNTGNGIGSNDVRDLSDNAVNLDFFANGPAASYPDRFGTQRKTVAQMNAEFLASEVSRASTFIASQNAKQAEFNQLLKNSAYEVPVDYVAGLGITRPTQTVRFGGELYRGKDANLPFTTTTWAADAAKFFAIGDAALRQEMASSDPTKNVALLAAPRLTRYESLQNQMQTILGSIDQSMWALASLVLIRPTAGDPSTWDWSPAFQMASDIGGPWRIPPNPDGTKADYRIGKNIQGRFNRRTSFYGSRGNRPSCRIITTDAFSDQSMFRQWDESWYAAGETDKNQRPANLAPYSANIDRYLNFSFIEFYITSAAGGEVTCLDLVALQETSYFEGLVFNGTSGIDKGWPIRIRSGGGSEVSMNGCSVRNTVVYGNGWRGELTCSGSGSDLDVDTWVTANTQHKESPFQFGTIDVSLRNMHCEAYAVGLPTFKSTGTGGFSMPNAFVVVQNLQGDVVDSEGPPSIGQLTLYPVGGLSSNVTNRASINAIVDRSGGSTTQTIRKVPLMLRNSSVILSRVGSYSRGHIACQDGNGRELVVTSGTTNFQLAGTSNNAATPLEIPYRLAGSADPTNCIDVVLFGRRVSSGTPAYLKVRLMESNIPSGASQVSATVIENTNWPGTVTLSQTGEYFSVVTTDATGVQNISATGSGPLFFNAATNAA